MVRFLSILVLASITYMPLAISAPPVFIRTNTGYGVMATGSTAAVSESSSGYYDQMDFDFDSGESVDASSVAAANSGDNSATANFQTVVSTGASGQTAISAPGLSQGVVTLTVDEYGYSSGNYLSSMLWETNYVVDDLSNTRDSSATYTATISVSYEWDGLATNENAINEGISLGYVDDFIQLSTNAGTLRIQNMGNNIWRATNGTVTDYVEVEDNAVIISISKEITLTDGDTVSVSGLLSMGVGVSSTDDSYMGAGEFKVDVTVTPVDSE